MTVSYRRFLDFASGFLIVIFPMDSSKLIKRRHLRRFACLTITDIYSSSNRSTQNSPCGPNQQNSRSNLQIVRFIGCLPSFHVSNSYTLMRSKKSKGVGLCGLSFLFDFMLYTWKYILFRHYIFHQIFKKKEKNSHKIHSASLFFLLLQISAEAANYKLQFSYHTSCLSPTKVLNRSSVFSRAAHLDAHIILHNSCLIN